MISPPFIKKAFLKLDKKNTFEVLRKWSKTAFQFNQTGMKMNTIKCFDQVVTRTFPIYN